MKTLLSALTILVLSSSFAQAVSTTFDFTNGTRNWTYGALNYEEDGLLLSVSAGRYKHSAVLDQGEIKQYNGNGLTIWSHKDNNHEIDGHKSKDVAVFEFSEHVILESVTFGYNGSDDRFAYFFDEGDNGSLDLINSALNANPTNDIYTFLGSLLKSGDFFGIGALGENDDFKIRSLTVNRVSAVPLPAALPLYGAGIAILGFVGWRRKQKRNSIPT
ncbi:MAG: VPLPA-CTERM sorting domain-containing protein [Sneathiella sp.]|nr:VPLPA-CTERM sorting domain-containing protein [Sneathiella sp.]